MGLFNKRSREDEADDALRDDNAQSKAKKAQRAKQFEPWKKAINTLRFDSHKKLERRIFYTGASIAVLTIGMGVSYHHTKYEEYIQSQQLTNYDTSVSFSKSTSVTMTLQKMALSSDKKTAFIPFTFSNLDSISSDANNYYVLILPTSGNLQYYPSGQFILFGTSGRGVIELHNESGFKSQPLKVLIRNDKNLNVSDSDANSDVSDTSDSLIAAVEQKYDMLDFTVNPGARDARSVDVGSTNTPTELYNAIFGAQDIKKITKANKSNEQAITKDKALATEYRQRLASMGFNVPNDPKWMADDWKPYDWVQDNGVPYNLRGKVTADQQKTSAIDGTLKLPTENGTDSSDNDPDGQKFPDVLKRPDGSTTNDSQTVNGPASNGASSNGTGDSGTTGDASSINGTASDPAGLWSQLQSVWNDVKINKRRIYSVNAMTLYQIKVFGDQQQQLASVGSKQHFRVTNIQS